MSCELQYTYVKGMVGTALARPQFWMLSINLNNLRKQSDFGSMCHIMLVVNPLDYD